MPRLTSPDNWPAAGPSHGLPPLTLQTSESSTVAPDGADGTDPGLTRVNSIHVRWEKPAGGTTWTVMLPPSRLRRTSPTSWTSKHRRLGGTKPRTGDGAATPASLSLSTKSHGTSS